jgi:hypothetical protein
LVYTLLWSRDRELNPAGLLFSKLILSYRDKDVFVPPPKPEDLDTLQQELILRRQRAMTVLSERPPQARPTLDNCQYCGVRQLCDQYWCAGTLKALTATGHDPTYLDLQVLLLAPHGPSSWDGLVELSGTIKSGKPIVLRTPPSLWAWSSESCLTDEPLN